MFCPIFLDAIAGKPAAAGSALPALQPLQEVGDLQALPRSGLSRLLQGLPPQLQDADLPPVFQIVGDQPPPDILRLGRLPRRLRFLLNVAICNFRKTTSSESLVCLGPALADVGTDLLLPGEQVGAVSPAGDGIETTVTGNVR